MSFTYRFPGAVLTEREHAVPLDHGAPDGDTISVFTREVADPKGLDKPYLLFLQGGPGFEARRPTTPPAGWIKRALKDYRVLLLDQRGTGRSTPVNSQLPGDTPQEQADYLANFRADSIVRDAELIRQELGVDRWSVLGQSFGGFCSLTYLSIAPQGLREALITGGLSPIGTSGRRCLRGDLPEDGGQEPRVLRPLSRTTASASTTSSADSKTKTSDYPEGDRLTARRFRQMGLWIGFSTGLESLHQRAGAAVWLQRVHVRRGAGPRHISSATRSMPRSTSRAMPMGASRTGHRRGCMPAEFERRTAGSPAEHIFPWMFDDYGALRPHKEAAELLAQREWPRLYDADVLAHNEVPVAATIYFDDPFVVQEFARETASAVRGPHLDYQRVRAQRPWP